jgi:plasmid stabilization system protein ParE
MAYSVRYFENADVDFDGIPHFIAQDKPLRAISFVDELRQRSADALEAFPNSGKPFGAARMLSFGHYIIPYHADEAARTVTNILVTGGHRDWQELLEGRL